MKRSIKNVIMLVLVVAIIVLQVITIINAKNSSNTNPAFSGNGFEMQVPPEGNENMVGEVPEKPVGEENSEIMPTDENMQMPIDNRYNRGEMVNTNTFNSYLILIGVENLSLSLIIMYLVLSSFNKKTFKETFISGDKIAIYIMSIIILTTVLTVVGSYISNVNKQDMNNPMMEEEVEKETTADDVETGTTVNEEIINLNEYSNNVTITKAGTYTLKGEFKYAVIVNADGDVTLNLDNVKISSEITAAIANISTNTLNINILEGTTNTLSDSGSSEYDACIYSIGTLVIDGTGKLNVYGKQSEGEGIATETNDVTINGGNIYIESNDDGINAGGDGGMITVNGGNVFIKASGDGIDSNQEIEINGGTVYSMGSSLGGDAGIDADAGFALNGGTIVALGSDMLETPLTTSKQNAICFNLTTKISSGTLVTLVNSNNEVIVSFEAKEDFKTLILSSDKLTNGTYYLYTGGNNSGEEINGIYTGGTYTAGEKVTVGSNSEFIVSGIVTKIN